VIEALADAGRPTRVTGVNDRTGKICGEPSVWRWIQPETLRYYQAELLVDLLGDWCLVYAWGGLGSARGSRRVTGVASEEEGRRKVAKLDTHRQKRGYQTVETFAHWRAQAAALRSDIPTHRPPTQRGSDLLQELELG
jgi:predicted DNA-binding WGR domain protein